MLHSTLFRTIVLAGSLLVSASGCTQPRSGPGASGRDAPVGEPSAIEGRWRVLNVLTQVETIIAPTTETPIFIEFQPRSMAAPGAATSANQTVALGYAGVNRFSAPYMYSRGELKVGALSIGPVVATRMAGPPNRNAFETALLTALESARTATVDGETLMIDSGDARVTLMR
ncbi:MAG: META domain-containing protein [Phycisphaerae bacterium]|nr:META domain-containing protein [Phycisphaerae bacterium]